jgi:hypothetical protein
VKLLRTASAWLFDRATCPAPARRALSASVFSTFVILVLVGAAHHQIWRDEARALSVALEPDSWTGIPAALENEGHPGLWYLVLRFAYAVVGTTLALQLVTAAFGIGAAALLFFRAPLPTWWRTIWLFGWVPLYEGSILCRNYGIGMLLLFAFCHLIRRAAPRPLLAAVALALLANTSFYGTMIAGGLALFLLGEVRRSKKGWPRLALVLLILGAGLAASVWTMWPTTASKVMPSASSGADPVGVAFDAVRNFGNVTSGLFGYLAPLAWLIVLLTVAATMGMPHLAASVLVVFVGAAWFMRGIYGAGPHHLGMLLCFLAAVSWLRAAGGAVGPPWSRIAWSVLLVGVWPLLLVGHAWRGLREIDREVECIKTSAPELARLLEREELAGAVLIGQPDYFLDALPFYRDNRIFIAREGRFRQRVSFTTANRRELDLADLLAAARTLKDSEHAPVLLVIGHAMRLDQPSGDIVFGYGDRFRWTAQQYEQFRAATELVASLPSEPGRFLGDERYDVFRLR